MIPRRIRLEGFLCYRQPQELLFDDGSLWMLAGLNGSGKSAVFDAVTYALFGGHRGGKQNFEDLINKESDNLVVDFEFHLADDLYRIHRTLRRAGKSTRQLHRRVADRWEPVEGTSAARGFDEWIKDRIGLNYETFTSSVLLMQGQADKLLNADGNERRKVLAGIVDLERYEKLHKRSDEQRKKHKDRAEELQNKLSVTAEVTDEEWTAAEIAIETAQGQLEQARAEVERWHKLEVQAERWAELTGKLANVRQQWEQAKGLLAEADAIEADWARLRELRDVLPQLRTAADQIQRLDESLKTTVSLSKEREAQANRVQELTYAEEQTCQKRDRLKKDVDRDVQREQELSAELQEMAATLGRVELFEKQKESAARVEAELARLAFDPTALARDREECDRLSETAQVLPTLTRLHRKRVELKQSQKELRLLVEEEKTLTERGKKLGEEVKAAAEALEKARAERRKADEWAAAARTRWDDAVKERKELDTLSGEKRCRRCGQELTPDHLEEETRRREKDRVAAEEAHRSAEKVSRKAVDVETHWHARHAELQQQLVEARDRFRDGQARAKALTQTVAQAARECAEAFDELPEAERRRVAATPPDDWAATTYPAETDLAQYRKQTEGLTVARQRLKQAEALQDQWMRLTAERDAATRSLHNQQAGLPSDPTAFRRDHAARKAEDADLKKTLKAARAQLHEDEKTLERLARDRYGAQKQVSERDQKIEVERVRQETCRDALGRAKSSLPDAWAAEVETLTAERLQPWQKEFDGLERKGAETRARALDQARQQLEPLRRELAHRQADLDAIPGEARCELTVVRQRLSAAKQDQSRREDELAAARAARQQLADRRERRRQLHTEFLAEDGQHNRYKLLAELLGPKRLQLHLVRRAEAGIVEFANEVLDRLSAGQLYLRLRRGDDETVDRALELEAFVRSAGESPVSVPFLSGSQRFRVAVSLALGIGRFASRSHRPIESVIIDEGFGCLDRQGRQTMIQELQNLRDNMRCILLVSHQEEFADAFPNGYRFELSNGSTEVTRFQR